jgi:tetratricopeptide (TPR) repeat protein
MNTLCLNMIVKNEANVIERLLESVYPIIDTYCICDTGSSDNTVEIITRFFNDRGMRGKIVSCPFVNFEYSRNFALSSAAGMADYLLLLDADMVLDIKQFDKESLHKHYHYCILQGTEDFYYYNKRIVRNDGRSSYRGVTHEFLDTPQDSSYDFRKDEMFIVDIGDGGAKQNKFERDIELLEQGVKEEPNNDRYYFYLANSYLSVGRHKDALETYDKRISMGGWDQEVWYSLFQKGLCYKYLNEPEKSVDSFLKAFEIIPYRLENFYELVKLYREQGNNKLANFFCQMAKSIKSDINKDTFLFYDATTYRYKLDYELSIVAFYNGVKNVDDSVVKVLNECNEFSLRASVISNNKFYDTLLRPLWTVDFTDKIYDDFIFNSSSPCIIENGDGYLMNVRYVNYYYNEAGQIELFNKKDPRIISLNKYVYLDKAFNTLESGIFTQDRENKLYVGVEDVRIFRTDSGIKFLGTGFEGDLTIATGEYDTESATLQYSLLRQTFNKTDCEKNWVFANENSLIYSWKPFICMSYHTLEVVKRIDDMPKIFDSVRGSTCAAEYNDELWFICHIVSYEQPRQYYHMFVVLDKELNLLRYSAPFKLSDASVEYCLGLIVKEDKVIISYSEWDRTTKIGIYDKKYIDSKIKYKNA